MKIFKTVFYFIFFIILIGFASIAIYTPNSSGGEQIPLRFVIITFYLICIGVFIISLYQLIFNRKKNTNEKLTLSIFLIISGFLGSGILNNFNIDYFFGVKSLVTGNIEVNGKYIHFEKKYYDEEDTKLKSQKFWIGDKKDSLWIEFDKNGNIVSKKKYKNDILIE